MSTCCVAPAPLVVAPWWQRGLDRLAEGWAAWRGPAPAGSASLAGATERDYEALAGLSPATLRDIGAPEWLLDRAEHSRHLASQPLHW